ncbi:thymidylate synthase [Actinomadura keratinilytica]|uniref:Thymidylate synthase/dCMP hydroxymethylase domain-containing protein n=1 Tax=Actinomadura keratinilytica TaxID=547461 RepID=A0ABP6ULB1_9ACTN
MIALTNDSATELWRDAVAVVVEQGAACAPRGLSTREVVDVHLELTSPRRRLVCAPPVRVINAAFAVAETVWILAGVDDGWIYTYNQRLRQFADDHVLRGAYGPRLRAWAGCIDQLDQARRLLLDDPESRRAVVQLWDPLRDHKGNKDVPCTLGWQFILRDGRLDLHTTMRSQDLWLGFCYDLFTDTVLHELMASWVGAELGTYHHHVMSLHLYDEHLPAAQDLLTGLAVRPSPVMPQLSVPWQDFDTLLQAVIEDRDLDHPGWANAAAVMRSYRIRRSGDHGDAYRLAHATGGPLGEALLAWYEHLDRAAQHLPDPIPESDRP